MRQALESHNDAIGFGFWIPAFAGMTGVKPLIYDSARYRRFDRGG